MMYCVSISKIDESTALRRNHLDNKERIDAFYVAKQFLLCLRVSSLNFRSSCLWACSEISRFLKDSDIWSLYSFKTKKK